MLWRLFSRRRENPGRMRSEGQGSIHSESRLHNQQKFLELRFKGRRFGQKSGLEKLKVEKGVLLARSSDPYTTLGGLTAAGRP